MSPRLVVVGECMVEMAPREGGGFAMGFAGDAFNTAWYAKRLAGDALEVEFASAVGDDDASRAMAAFMAASGVRPRLAMRPGRSVGLYLIMLRDGERRFSYWREASAARTLAEDLDALAGLGPADLTYYSGITLAILPEAGRERLLDAMAGARRAGARVLFDPNLRLRLWESADAMRLWVMRAAAGADVALPSFDDERDQFGDVDPAATARRYLGAGAGLCLVKDGPRPVLVAGPRGNAAVAPPPSARVVDTTAAGDSFNAGYIVGALQGLDDRAAAAMGCALSAVVIGHRGALAPVEAIAAVATSPRAR